MKVTFNKCSGSLNISHGLGSLDKYSYIYGSESRRPIITVPDPRLPLKKYFVKWGSKLSNFFKLSIFLIFLLSDKNLEPDPDPKFRITDPYSDQERRILILILILLFYVHFMNLD